VLGRNGQMMRFQINNRRGLKVVKDGIQNEQKKQMLAVEELASV
jgi:hypothetical protein